MQFPRSVGTLSAITLDAVRIGSTTTGTTPVPGGTDMVNMCAMKIAGIARENMHAAQVSTAEFLLRDPEASPWGAGTVVVTTTQNDAQARKHGGAAPPDSDQEAAAVVILAQQGGAAVGVMLITEKSRDVGFI